MIKRIKKTSIVDLVVKELGRSVLEGDLEPGQRIPSENELVHALGVSRTAVREAKKTLSAIGLLEIRPGNGTYVKDDLLDFISEPLGWGVQLEKGRIIELVEARKILETETASLAAKRVSAEDKDSLNKLLNHMQSALRENDNEAFVVADLAFHIAIAKAAGNNVIVKLILSLRTPLEEFIRNVLEVPASAEMAMQDHREIASAIFEGELDKARNAMAVHLENVERRIIDKIERENKLA